MIAVPVTLSESPGKRSGLAANNSGKKGQKRSGGFIISIKHPRYQWLIQHHFTRGAQEVDTCGHRP